MRHVVSGLCQRLVQKPAWHNAALTLLLFGVGLLLTAVGERIPVNGGLGYDGAEYGQWAMHLDAVLDGGIPVTAYRVMRMLPSVLAHGTLRLLGAGLTAENVIQFFVVYNLTLLCLASLAWGGIADALSFGFKTKLLGFLGLFGNHAILKFNFYYPVLTDVSGYAGAIFLLWAFVRRKTWLALFLTLAGAFCWPPLFLYGLVILLFPRRDQTARRPLLPIGIVAGTLVALGYAVLAATPLTGLKPYYPLAAAVVTLYLGLAFFLLFASPYSIAGMLRRATTVWRLTAAALALATVLAGRLLLTRTLASSGSGGFFHLPLGEMALTYLRTTCVPLSTRLPGEFLVAHVLYFGPLLFLTALFPRRTAVAAGRLGLGFFLLVALAVGHGIVPLSRQWLAGYPFVVLATVWGVSESALSRNFLVVFSGISLLISKVWMLFNLERTSTLGPDGLVVWATGFSFEQYVSSTGRWMSVSWYVGQFFVLSIIFIYYYLYFHNENIPRSRTAG